MDAFLGFIDDARLGLDVGSPDVGCVSSSGLNVSRADQVELGDLDDDLPLVF